ncbi:MAG: hypothetical protein GY769_11975 [bacterium]|nr:hypothetical protein [bacterium]
MSRRHPRPSAATVSPLATATALILLAALCSPAASQNRLTVVAVSPAARSLAADVDSSITVEFDRPVLTSSVSPASFWAFGRWSGAATGTYAFGNGDRTVTLTPDRRFSAGETVMVLLSRDLQAMDGSFLRDAGFSFQFWTRSRGAGFGFSEIDRFSTRTSPEITTRAYGGFGSDLDGDGFLDLTIVNEDTNDLRTFLNRGDRSGRFHDFLRPTAATENVPSPSEPTDFDRDGNVDVVVANTQDDSVSVFLGNGDGTFQPASHYSVGGEPRGVAVLDADGDGDVDIAATSFFDGQVAVLFNDGAGGFASASTFGTQRGERAIGAGDMNEDGILDLVVGALTAGEIDVYTGNGDGTFDRAATRSAGGEIWMLVLGDVNGDGSEDVAAVNSDSNNAAILRGDGAGGLSDPQIVATDDFPLATDLADLDGDGDLDWVTSSFFGNWMMWENDGGGAFSLDRSFPAPQAASCSLPMDLDNDGVLDLVLIDELEDEIVLMKNRAVLFADDFESGDTRRWSRSRGSVLVVAPGLRGSGRALEVTVDGTRTRSYLQSKRPAKEASVVVSFDLDAAGLELGGGDEIEILRLGAGSGQARLMLERAGARFRARLFAREKGGFREIGSTRVPAKGVARLEIEWSSASGRSVPDGRAALVKRGKLRAVVDDLSNHGRVVNKVRLGLPAGASGDSSGSFVLDNYLSTR